MNVYAQNGAPFGSSGGGFANPATEDLDMGAYDIIGAGGNSVWTVMPSEGSAGIQAAVTAASEAGGGVVQLKSGTYACTTAIVWPNDASGVILRGVGRATVLSCTIPLTDPPTNPWLLYMLGNMSNDVPVDDTTADDTSFTTTTHGNAANFVVGEMVLIKGTDENDMHVFETNFVTAKDGSTGIVSLKTPLAYTLTSVNVARYISGAFNGVERLSIEHNSGGAHSIGIGWTRNCFIRDVYIDGKEFCGGDSISMFYAIDCQVIDLQQKNIVTQEQYPTVGSYVNPWGISVQNLLRCTFERIHQTNIGYSDGFTGPIAFGGTIQEVIFKDIIMEDCPRVGVYAGGTVYFIDVIFDSVQAVGINLQNFYLVPAKFENVLFRGCSFSNGRNAFSPAIQISSTDTTSTGLKIIGCEFRDWPTEPINVQGMDTPIIVGCSFVRCVAGPYMSSMEGLTLSGNVADSCPGSAFGILSITSASISGNTAINCGYGLKSDGSCIDVVVSGNTFNASTDPIRLLDSDTYFTIVGNNARSATSTIGSGIGHIIKANQGIADS